MYHSTNKNSFFLTIAESNHKTEWKTFVTYCKKREKGLRNKAFTELETFLIQTNEWTITQKIDFIYYLFPIIESCDIDYQVVIPHPLDKQLIQPTLKKWCEYEKLNSNPFRWYGKYFDSEKHLEKAVNLNPSDDLARIAILGLWLPKIRFSIPILPNGFRGNILEDDKIVDKITNHLLNLKNPDSRNYWQNAYKNEIEIINNYHLWQASGYKDLFVWGKEFNKRVSLK